MPKRGGDMVRSHARVGTRLSMLVFVALLAGCTNDPAPVVDASATDLDVKIAVVESTDEAKTLIILQFLQNGHIVQVKAHVSCDGFKLDWNGLFYGARIPKVAGRKHYGCLYTHPTGLDVVNVDYRDPPTVTSPTPGATVTRTSAYSVAYSAGSATEVRGSARDIANPDHSVNGVPDAQPDDGSFDAIDTRTLQPGPGFVSVARTYTGSPALSNFNSATYEYTTGTTVSVSWT
jgi:hypothetical protein